MDMRVIGYIRVSTEEQATAGVSLAAQAEKVRGYCALFDLELVQLIEDPGASAKTLDRPGLQRALTMLRKGEAEGIVIAKLDRLTRSVADLATLISDFFGEKAGRSLFSVADSIDTRTAAGRMVLNILVSVSQWEREAIGERTRDALRHKRATGQVYNHEPLGFVRSGDRLVEVEDEMNTVAEVRRLAAEGVSLRRICAQMTAHGYRTKKGGAWRPSTVQAILRRGAAG
ncbi:MAG TPA: recombinase family protein [Polyangia bacterium]|jgi:DNA invertase Pin-like site-specific DNA recombinase|nr:recombinase family protein [Polyangia bacterium]